MYTLNPRGVLKFLQHTSIRHKEPVCIWGSPGISKSDLIRLLAKMYDAFLIDIRLSQYEAVDLRGIPDIEDSLTVWNMPSTLPFKGNPKFDHVPDDVTILLFLDEITSVAQSVEPVTYELIQDRRVGEHELRDNVIIVAAANRDGDKGATRPMKLPVCNRFTHVEMVPDVMQWSEDFAMPAGLDPVRVSFFQWKKQLFNTFDPRNQELGKAFSTPRSVTKAIRLDMDEETPLEIRKAQVAGCIGAATAAEYHAYVELFHKVPKIEAILANPERAHMPDTEELSLRYATVASVSGHMTADNADVLHRYLKRFDQDMVILGWLMATSRDEAVMESNAFMEVARTYKDIFAAHAAA